MKTSNSLKKDITLTYKNFKDKDYKLIFAEDHSPSRPLREEIKKNKVEDDFQISLPQLLFSSYVILIFVLFDKSDIFPIGFIATELDPNGNIIHVGMIDAEFLLEYGYLAKYVH